MAILKYVTKKLPKNIFVVRYGDINRVFWSYGQANKFFETCSFSDEYGEENVSLVRYKVDE